MPRGTQDLLLRAERAGEHIGRLAEEIYGQEKEYGVRRILGVLSLARKYGARRRRRRLRRGARACLPTYRFVRRYLERHPPVQLSLRQNRSAHPRAHPLPRCHQQSHQEER